MESSLPLAPLPPAGGRYWLVFCLSLAALALLYFLTIPGNHAEAQDAFWYAYDAREKPFHALFHIHHLLYLPVMHALYLAVHPTDAYDFLIGVDLLCGVATVGLLYLWLERGMRLGRPASLFGSLFLAFCYGYWRYSVEVEVYLPSLVLTVLLAWRVLRRTQGPPGAGSWAGRLLTALLATAAVLMHAPLAVPLAVVAVPIYLLLTRRWRALAVYAVVPTVLLTGIYYAAWQAEVKANDPTMPPPGATFAKFLVEVDAPDDAGVKLSNVPKTAIGLGADVVSSGYLFAIPAVRDRLFAAFPGRNLARDAFTARSYSRSLAYIGLGLTVVLLGLIGFVAVARLEWSRERLRALLAWPETVALLLWLGAYFVLVGVVEPENPENWVNFLLPLAVLAALLVHFLYRDAARAKLPWVFVGLLLAQNLLGGFFVIHNPDSDLNRHRSAWVIAHARAGDVVFTRDNDVFTRFVRYHTPAQVVNCAGLGAADTRAAVAGHQAGPGGTRYLYADVLTPPVYLQKRYPTLNDDLAGLRAEWIPTLAPTGDDDVKRLP